MHAIGASQEGHACDGGNKTEDKGRPRVVSRDTLAGHGAGALAEILMRASLKHPDIADELASIEPSRRSGDPAAARSDRRPADEFYMVGACPPMQDVFQAIRRFAPTAAPVLLTGESGTGKELVAQAIHERSSFAQGPLVTVNCAGLPASLIASELFGHEKGSFTGATRRRAGRIESAEGGTLFLDEIGDLPMELQSTLLRFLQDHTIERVGGDRPIVIRTRVIAATNVNLEEAVTGGRFRQDLFFRLDVLRIHLPPLHRRGSDIELLTRYFVKQIAGEFGVDPAPEISPDAIAALQAYSWPGNVRELISKLRRAVIMAGEQPLEAADFDLGDKKPAVVTDGNTRLITARAIAEMKAVAEALDRTGFNVTRAAKELGVSRVTMYKLMARHDISR
ncbi:MAG: sigma-54 dependent transcriptional regulator [Alphaproteobacteria bacterium]